MFADVGQTPMNDGATQERARTGRPERRAHISREAARLFADAAYHEVSVRSIAKEAGVSVGSLYQYFDSKEKLLLHAIMGSMESCAADVRRAMGAEGNAIDRLGRGFLTYCTIIDHSPRVACLAYRQVSVLSGTGRALIYELEVGTAALFIGAIEQGTRSGVFRGTSQPALAAFNLVVSAHMWGMKHWYFRKSMSLADYVEEEFRYQLRYLAYDPAAAEEWMLPTAVDMGIAPACK